jgi:tetratricopeptide (TPR) repeat protein
VAKSRGFGKPSKAKKAGSSRRSPAQAQLSRTTAETLALAFQQFQAEQFEQAAQLYRGVLQQQPNQPEALHWLGVILCQSGRDAAGFPYLQQAVALKPDDANLHNSLGAAWMRQGNLEQAAAYLQRAVALQPNHFIAHTNLGGLLRDQGNLQAAVDHCRTALRLNPNYASAHQNLGLALLKQGNLQEAATCLQQAVALVPHNAEFHHDLGNVFLEQEQWEAAVNCYRQAIALRPSDTAYTNLGNALSKLGQFETALQNLQAALSLNPHNPVTHDVLGVMRMEQGDLEQALMHLRQAVFLAPNSADTHYNLALALLAQGDLRAGFAEHEWRWHTKKWVPALFPQPLWDGSPLAGKTIMLHAEQGFGDTIQFIRYLPLVKARGGRIVAACQPPLKPLLALLPDVEHLIIPGDDLPEFDVQAPLLSLPYLLGTTLETIPAQIPYLPVPTCACQSLELLPDTRMKVGVVWASGRRGGDRASLRFYEQKSCPILSYARLFAVAEISFYSLQVGENAADLAQLEGEYPLQDLSPQIQDFADTTALIVQMDLVISVDTAVAHLAGALGKPVWLLLPLGADWRWMRKRQDSPWYPTMRLFRQAQLGDWEGVIDRVTAALKRVVAGELAPMFEVEPAKSGVIRSQQAKQHSTPHLQAVSVSHRVQSSQPNSIQTDFSQALAEALQHYQTGQWTEAEQRYRQIFQQQPDQPDALHWLGVIVYQSGRREEGFHYLQQAVALKPEDANIQNSIGAALLDQGNLEQAAVHLQQAIDLYPNHHIAHKNLATVFQRQGHQEQAVFHLQQTIRFTPKDAEAHYNLGLALKAQGKIEAAIASYRKAIDLNPNHTLALVSLAELLREQDKTQEAILCFQTALVQSPNDATAHTGLGIALQEQGDFEQALTHLQKVVELHPDHAQAHCNLGALLWAQCQPEQAIEPYQRAIQLQPDYAEAHVHLAQALLVTGDLRKGFAEYEWRWRMKDWTPCRFAQPMWDGLDLNGKTILISADEGGFGDFMQFIRYAPLVSDRGGQVVVECSEPVSRLLATAPGVNQIVGRNEAFTEFDVYTHLMSLPYFLGTTLETIPAQVPYLAPPADDDYTLELRPDTKLKVGLIWASGHKTEHRNSFKNYQERSCPLSLYTKLLSVSGVRFYSLQVGLQVADMRELGVDHRIQDLSPKIKDFADTAALIDQMDLVISVDTAVAHLAGALGKPVWVLLPFAADWRWLRDRQDSPWYPTMQLFWQPRPKDWESVLGEVLQALQSLANAQS